MDTGKITVGTCTVGANLILLAVEGDPHAGLPSVLTRTEKVALGMTRTSVSWW